jgi:hypothetical protein
MLDEPPNCPGNMWNPSTTTLTLTVRASINHVAPHGPADARQHVGPVVLVAWALHLRCCQPACPLVQCCCCERTRTKLLLVMMFSKCKGNKLDSRQYRPHTPFVRVFFDDARNRHWILSLLFISRTRSIIRYDCDSSFVRLHGVREGQVVAATAAAALLLDVYAAIVLWTVIIYSSEDNFYATSVGFFHFQRWKQQCVDCRT